MDPENGFPAGTPDGPVVRMSWHSVVHSAAAAVAFTALAVAAMSTVGYTGFVVGPPLMGWLAETAGLRLTMASIAICTLGVAITGLLDRMRMPPERKNE